MQYDFAAETIIRFFGIGAMFITMYVPLCMIVIMVFMAVVFLIMPAGSGKRHHADGRIYNNVFHFYILYALFFVKL